MGEGREPVPRISVPKEPGLRKLGSVSENLGLPFDYLWIRMGDKAPGVRWVGTHVCGWGVPWTAHTCNGLS